RVQAWTLTAPELWAMGYQSAGAWSPPIVKPPSGASHECLAPMCELTSHSQRKSDMTAVTDLPIVLEDISLSAGSVTMLDRISLALVAGSPTVLIGPNGAGKTTLLRLIMGLIPPTRGRVTWGGREQAASTHRAIVFQRPTMLRRSAA